MGRRKTWDTSANTQHQILAESPEPQPSNIPPLGEYEYRRRQMQEERKAEYNQYLAAKPPVQMSNNGYSKENVRPAGGGEGGLVSKMGAFEDSRRRLREERNREYNDFRDTCVNKLPRVRLDSEEARILTHDLLIASPVS